MGSAMLRRRLLATLPWAVLAVLVAVDTASTRIIISGAYPTAAVVASTMTSVRRTAAVAGVSVALAGVSQLWNDYLGPADLGLRLVLAGILGAVAVLASQVRVRRERDLANMTVIAETVQQAVLRGIPRHVSGVGFATEYSPQPGRHWSGETSSRSPTPPTASGSSSVTSGGRGWKPCSSPLPSWPPFGAQPSRRTS